MKTLQESMQERLAEKWQRAREAAEEHARKEAIKQARIDHMLTLIEEDLVEKYGSMPDGTVLVVKEEGIFEFGRGYTFRVKFPNGNYVSWLGQVYDWAEEALHYDPYTNRSDEWHATQGEYFCEYKNFLDAAIYALEFETGQEAEAA